VEPRWQPEYPARRGLGIGTVLAASVVSGVVSAVVTLALVGVLGQSPTVRSTSVVLAPSGATPSSAPPTPGSSASAAVATPSPAPASPPPAAPSAPGASGAAPSPGSTSPSPSLVAAPPAPSLVLGTDPNAVIVAVAARVSPAVVTITSEIAPSQFDPFSIPSSGVGSGFVFAADGWILTNDHVVEGASTLTVAFKNGRSLKARVVAVDRNADLAVLKVDATGLVTVDIGSSTDLHVGQLLIAIGSPLGTFSDSVTSGILSAIGRSVTVTDYQARLQRRMTNLLQTDAAINPGNSGGPLLDARGFVVGINSAMATSAEGIGFAIPIDAARAIMDQARSAP